MEANPPTDNPDIIHLHGLFPRWWNGPISARRLTQTLRRSASTWAWVRQNSIGRMTTTPDLHHLSTSQTRSSTNTLTPLRSRPYATLEEVKHVICSPKSVWKDPAVILLTCFQCNIFWKGLMDFVCAHSRSLWELWGSIPCGPQLQQHEGPWEVTQGEVWTRSVWESSSQTQNSFRRRWKVSGSMQLSESVNEWKTNSIIVEFMPGYIIVLNNISQIVQIILISIPARLLIFFQTVIQNCNSKGKISSIKYSSHPKVCPK